MNELIKKVTETLPVNKTHNNKPVEKFQYKTQKKQTGPGFDYYLQKACEKVDQPEEDNVIEVPVNNRPKLAPPRFNF